MQADSAFLFWINRQWIPGQGQFTIFRLSKAGGQPVELASYTHVNGSLALDDTYVYWRDYSGAVMRLPKTGEGTPQPAPVPALVFDGPDAYWLNASGDLVRSAKDGSSPVTLVTRADLDALAGRQPSNVYILQILPGSASLYFTVFVDNYPGMLSCTDQRTVLMRVPGSGGAYESVAWSAGRAEAFLLEPFAYLSGYCLPKSLQVNLDSLAAMSWGEAAAAMADDETYVYWADFDNGWIKRMFK